MRIRIFYQKSRDIRFTSTLDMQAIWQRSLKRAGLAVEYSQGFHPQPKLQLPFPLPLGYSGSNEIVDIWLKSEYPLDEIHRMVTPSLPEGIKITSIENIDGQRKSVTDSAEYAEFKVSVRTDAISCQTLQASIHALLETRAIMRERNRQLYDLRPLILSIGEVSEDHDICTFHLRLAAQPSKTGRPDEVMKALGLDLADCEFERLNVYFKN